jgi:hypothetical protein
LPAGAGPVARRLSPWRSALDYARRGHAARGHLADTAGAIAGAIACAAHAVLAARGEWITNEKRLIDRAGLRHADAVLAGLRADPAALDRAVSAAHEVITQAT